MTSKIERSSSTIFFNDQIWLAIKMRANKANKFKKSQPKLDANGNNMESMNNLNNLNNSSTPSKRLSLPLDLHFKERFLSRISLTPKLSPSLESSEPTTPVNKSFIRKSFVSVFLSFYFL